MNQVFKIKKKTEELYRLTLIKLKQLLLKVQIGF